MLKNEFYQVTHYTPDFKKELTSLELLGIESMLKKLFGRKGAKNYNYSSYHSTGSNGAMLGLHTVGTTNQLTIAFIPAGSNEETEREFMSVHSIKVSEGGGVFLVGHTYSEDGKDVEVICRVDMDAVLNG